MSQVDQTQNDRDAVTLKILGIFFVVIGVLVLLGTFWALGNFKAVVVNLASGVILATVGAIMTVIAKQIKRRST